MTWPKALARALACFAVGAGATLVLRALLPDTLYTAVLCAVIVVSLVGSYFQTQDLRRMAQKSKENAMEIELLRMIHDYNEGDDEEEEEP